MHDRTMASFALDTSLRLAPLLEQEKRSSSTRADPEYFTRQTDLTPRRRGVFVGWMMDATDSLDLCSETLHLSVNFLDRVLSRRTVARKDMHILCTVCLWTAHKYEEVYNTWHISAFEEMAGCKANALRTEEMHVLRDLDYRLTIPTASHFTQMILSGDDNKELFDLASCLADVSLLDAEMLRFSASDVGMSSVRLARELLDLPTASEPPLSPTDGCIEALKQLHADRQHLQQAESRPSKRSRLSAGTK